jgi:predicted dehydrogenase
MKRKSITLPLRVGVVGCGNVSDTYFKHAKAFFREFEIVACASRTLANAEAKASQYGIGKVCTVQALLNDSEIDLVLNLTNPTVHTKVNLQALQAGKHIYCEKPFAVSYEEAKQTLQEAAMRKLCVGCAPDTVLGTGIQTCRKLIEEGAIGKPIAATANMLNHGSEHWHPNPDFFYQRGGGPLFGAGPYYFSALVTMLGAAQSVSALAKSAFKKRQITSRPFRGQTITVRTPTHCTSLVEFAQGAVATVSMSFDVWAHHQPLLEIYGTEGSLQCPDPNQFDGNVLLWTNKTKEWRSMPLVQSGKMDRGLGLAEMALALQERRAPRASGELALHVVDIMESFHISASERKMVALRSTCSQPKALPNGL